MVRGRSQWRSGPDRGDHWGNQLPTMLSTSLWKTMGIPGLTCPQAATYRGSVGVEPALSCCAPCETTSWFLSGVQDLYQGQIRSVDLSTNL